MVLKKVCDRCGTSEKIQANEDIEFFIGSLTINDVDLCDDCFVKFAGFLDKFASSEEGE